MAADLSTAKRLHMAEVECGAKYTLDLCENTHGSAYHSCTRVIMTGIISDVAQADVCFPAKRVCLAHERDDAAFC